MDKTQVSNLLLAGFLLAAMAGGSTAAYGDSGSVSVEDAGEIETQYTGAGHLIMNEVCSNSDHKKRCNAVSLYTDLSSLGTTAALCSFGGPLGCGLGVTLFA